MKFMDEKPKSTRGGPGGSRTMTDEVVAELQENPGKWGLVAEGVTSAQSVATWVRKPENKDSFDYTSVNSGKTTKNRNGKDVPTYNVYVCFKP